VTRLRLNLFYGLNENLSEWSLVNISITFLHNTHL
jgi:hypothetical protein